MPSGLFAVMGALKAGVLCFGGREVDVVSGRSERLERLRAGGKALLAPLLVCLGVVLRRKRAQLSIYYGIKGCQWLVGCHMRFYAVNLCAPLSIILRTSCRRNVAQTFGEVL